MSASGKYLLALLLVAGAILFFTVPILNRWKEQIAAANGETPAVPAAASPAVVRQISPPVAAQPQLSPSQNVVLTLNSIPPLPSTATSIPDSDLLTLARFSNSGEAAGQKHSPQEWQKAIDIAEKLKAGPCDCEQRNWLVRFIEMAQFARAGDEENYLAAARLLATLGRNDEQAMAMSQKPH